MARARAVLTACSIALCSGGALPARAAQPAVDADLLAAYGGEDFVTIATGSRQPLRKAPAIASVVTRDDIRALGARDLDEALAGVPGLHVSRSSLVYNPIYTFRGIHSQYNPQVLLLINGIPMTSVFAGDRGNIWGGMPVDNIERIEVIRGPGSALYGADAFAGVINVITRNPAEWKGTEAGLRAGSFGTRDAWANHASQLGPAALGLYAGWSTTDGDDQTIRSDVQTGLDQAFGTHASLAPGPLALGRKGVDLGLDLVVGNWQFRAAMKERRDVEPATGVASALDPVGSGRSRRWTADLTWHRDDLVADWDFTVQATYLHMTDFSELQLYPPGAFGNTFPDGMIGRPYKWERHGGVSGTAVFTGWSDHRVRLGGGYQTLDLYKIREVKNYTFAYVPGLGYLPVPLPGGLTDVSDTAPFQRPHERHIRYLTLQDEWAMSRNWTLTAGVRHDDYSDFGDTTNPRLALVWDAGYAITGKLMYGRAFRAPSFVELYNINNPVALGNRDVKPETIESWEAALTWQASRDLVLSANLFAYTIRDTLRMVPNSDPTTGSTARNTGSVDGKGVELEYGWKATPTLKLSGYYAYAHSRDGETGESPGNAPRQTAYLRADWHPLPHLAVTPRVYWVADRNREPARPNEQADTRDPVPDYALLDLTVTAEGVLRNLDLSLTVRNLADAAAYEPSPSPGLIADDFPLPGRSVLVSGIYRF